ncbi:MAG: DUF1887 family CARF protein [Firmicutes bacterium]|nr:DUF1887 family CARF protein [Bacillota bacterium]
MNTLIELYDERPVENVLATEVFKPERTVFLCPDDIAHDKKTHERLKTYFQHRGLKTELIFFDMSIYDASKIKRQLEIIFEKYPMAALDITGGTDAALFAGGLICSKADIPVFTYSRKRNRFFNIQNAPFANELDCTIKYSVNDCFLMAGGALRSGRFDNTNLQKYIEKIEPFFNVFLNNKSDWQRAISFIQRVSKSVKQSVPELHVDAPYTVKGERGGLIDAPEAVLSDFEQIGLIKNLKIVSGKSVSFDFSDHQLRNWLRDVGSVLELYIYKACLDSGFFHEVRTSSVVDWEGTARHDNVTNEIDVIAMRGIAPYFLSCKTCEISTEALNELAVLRDRFGGKWAKSVIVTAKRCRSITRHRAGELGITVIDADDLRQGRIREILEVLIRTQ